ncbi:hypothetical protein OJ997_23055 [Solirubrobacter phytolaccae]|uniref:Lipoprotein LpqB beta-propeller domain-containing protein n=1 Tax=Solirubrobacter phytolaccae TaxID=1404360 RepID=A0A9X3NB51_9ACTN|nr:hypothetical protein [Solirubrobacter phytolaccae]MDA0183208.1 hypothetical protein [Solirubrobacter phytolaccae]
MRWIGIIIAAVALVACGGKAAPVKATVTPTPTEIVATPTPSGPWTVAPSDTRTPLRCPASSARAGWPSRVLALGDDTYVKLWGRRPRLATVDARGHLLSQKELGAKAPADERALACGRGGATAAAWTEYVKPSTEGLDGDFRVVVDGRTVDTAKTPFSPPNLAVAFAPDGAVLVAYSVPKAVRAVLIPRDGKPGKPIELGPASDVSAVAADIGSGGRAIVAWSTTDGGEERNEHRRVYAVSGRAGRFGHAQRVDRAAHRNSMEFSTTQIRLAVAPNGRALLMWSTIANEDDQDRDTVRVAQAGTSGRFGKPRQLTDDGTVGDVAIRSNGDTLTVWRTPAGLFAAPGEQITDKATEPRASFRDGKPYVEWRGGSATRSG